MPKKSKKYTEYKGGTKHGSYTKGGGSKRYHEMLEEAVDIRTDSEKKVDSLFDFTEKEEKGK